MNIFREILLHSNKFHKENILSGKDIYKECILYKIFAWKEVVYIVKSFLERKEFHRGNVFLATKL